MKQFTSKIVMTFTPNVMEAQSYPQYVQLLKDSFLKDNGLMLRDTEIREVSILPSANDYTRNQLDRGGFNE